MIPWIAIGIGALGAVIGGTVVTLFGPVLQPAASYLNRKLWTTFGRFDPPQPRAYILTETRVKPGNTIGQFPNERWKDSYKLVDLHLQNTSGRSLTDLRAFLSFDGIVVDSTIMESSYRDVEVTPTAETEGEIRNQISSETLYGSAEHGAMDLFLDRLPPAQSVHVRFLIETDTSDVKSVVQPGHKDSVALYRWEFHNVTYIDHQEIVDESDLYGSF